MIVETPSPEMEEVPGAVSIRITVEKPPMGVSISTEYLAADGSQLRQDQHFIVNKGFESTGTAQLVPAADKPVAEVGLFW